MSYLGVLSDLLSPQSVDTVWPSDLVNNIENPAVLSFCPVKSILHFPVVLRQETKICAPLFSTNLYVKI